MSSPVINFGKVTVSTTYSAADVTIVLTTGHGARLPSTFPYPLTWWDSTTYPDPADDPKREIVTVTNRVGDTLTVTRGAESSGASTKNDAGKTYKMMLGITKGLWEELQDLSLSQTFRGLSLQTHPDADVDDKKVLLVHADAIVMDDGSEVANWDNLSADITASGAGGLDTGSEQASTWYEIYAIYNGTTKSLMLHRAKDHFSDEESTAGEDATQGIRSAVDNSTIRVAQGLQVDTAGPLEFIDVKLIKAGTPTGNIWFTIEANNAGVPSNTPLATSDKIDVSRISTTATWIRFPFRVPVSVSAATTYHLVAYGDWTVSATNYVGWRMDGSAGAYANGSKNLFDSDTSTWTTDTDDDMMFIAYITRNDTAVTLPTGYTRYAKIGYVFNNSGSNFKHFSAKDHMVFCGYDDDWQFGTFTSTTPALISAFSFLPPVAVWASLDNYNDGSNHYAIGNLKAIDLTGTTTDERVGMVRGTLNIGYIARSSLVLDKYQGFMFLTQGGNQNIYLHSFEW